MRLGTLVVLVLCGLMLSGCNSANQTSKKDTGKDDHGHSHAEDKGHSHGEDDHHDHVHGPNGGELFDIDGMDAKGEWVGKYDQNIIVLHILDAEGVDPHPVKADKLTLHFTKGKSPKTFEVPAVSPDENGMTSEFQLQDEELVMAMKGFGVDMEMVVDGKTYKADIPRDPHQ